MTTTKTNDRLDLLLRHPLYRGARTRERLIDWLIRTAEEKARRADVTAIQEGRDPRPFRPTKRARKA